MAKVGTITVDIQVVSKKRSYHVMTRHGDVYLEAETFRMDEDRVLRFTTDGRTVAAFQEWGGVREHGISG